MRKFFMTFALILMLFVSGISFPAYADSYTINSTIFDGSEITTTSIEADLCDFVYGEGAFDDSGERVDRTAGTEGELKAGDYLIAKLKDIFGISQTESENEKGLVTTQTIVYQTSLMGGDEETRNIIGYKKSSNTKGDYVVIGAHYDNYYGFSDSLYSEEGTKSHGIYDNASGVTALLNIAKLLQNKDLPYDVYYVFFGAEEIGRFGSLGFYEGFVQKYKGDMKLMINLDSIGNGDKLYMYADEVKTKHQDYFDSIANSKTGIKANAAFAAFEKINTPPANKKVDYLMSSGKIDYNHMGLNSDNSSFIDKGNNVITFFSGAWEGAFTGVNESSKNENLMHTSGDNITEVKKLYGDKFFSRIRQISYLCATALMQEDFIAVMNESSKTSGNYIFFTNSMYANIIIAAILTIAYVVFVLVIKKYKGTEPDGRLQKLKKAVMENNIDAISRPEEDVTEIIIEDKNT